MGLGEATGPGQKVRVSRHAFLALSLAAMVITTPAQALDHGDKDLAQGLINALNESDGAKRDALTAKIITEKAVFADKVVRAVGLKAISARLEAIQRGLQGQKFQLIGQIEHQQDALRFAFEVVDKTGTTAFEGMFFALVTNDGRLERIDMYNGATAAPLP